MKRSLFNFLKQFLIRKRELKKNENSVWLLKRIFVFAILLIAFIAGAQNNPPRVLLQAFWWDYKNNNYPNGWYNYLAELAPRLKGYGIDAIWIPPSSKGADHNDNGYTPFDHYDLGDKYQKGDVRTRMGTKDEYLRMVAVMHANGIDVIQDIVLNHMSNAGSANGSGGQDPNAPDDKWKNFRYTSFTTQATDESTKDYLNRNGRWPKNYQNFHRSGDNSWGHDDYNYPLHSGGWGQDICYMQNAINTNGKIMLPSDYGIATLFNPTQSTDYMKQQANQWGVWLKKQTGIDGVRLDAAKHVDYDDVNSPNWDVVESFLWNMQHGAGLYGSGSTWSNGTDNMFAVSEYVPEGGQPSMENFIDGAQNRTGTFDFNLRDGIYSMVTGAGFFDISQIPAYQINGTHRARTVSFVNNHDTFRPILDAVGNYTGWNVGNELRPHIDPFNDRLPAAYAIISAVDGSPQVFFEDLFNIGGTGKRWTHQPTNVGDLPDRTHISNIIWATRALNFAGGSYKVRTAEAGVQFDPGSSNADLLVIERSGKALIGVNDDGVNWHSCWVDTDFTAGTKVKDYSGANGAWTYTVDNSKRVPVNVPPSDSKFGGYCIIGPVGLENTVFKPAQRKTIQEWEMSTDLGDSHLKSLGQGGGLFTYKYNYVGKIFSDVNKEINIELYPDMVQFPNGGNFEILVDCPDNTYHTFGQANSVPLELNFLTTSQGWYKIYAKVYTAVIPINPSPLPDWPISHVWVKTTYTAPQVVDLNLDIPEAISSLDTNNELMDVSISVYPNPTINEDIKIQYSLQNPKWINFGIYDSNGNLIGTIFEGYIDSGSYDYMLKISELQHGTYYYKMDTENGTTSGRIVIDK